MRTEVEAVIAVGEAAGQPADAAPLLEERDGKARARHMIGEREAADSGTHDDDALAQLLLLWCWARSGGSASRT